MTKPFKLTPAMQEEMLNEVQSLTGNEQDTHDAVGARTGTLSPFQQNLNIRNSQGAEAGPTDDQEVPEDPINPSHYRKHPSGIECIEVTRHMNFNVGNAIKYLWRYMDKGDPVENLKKAQWYLDDEIRRLQGKQ